MQLKKCSIYFFSTTLANKNNDEKEQVQARIKCKIVWVWNDHISLAVGTSWQMTELIKLQILKKNESYLKNQIN